VLSLRSNMWNCLPRWLLAGTALLGLAGCLSPTLPLPPPDVPQSVTVEPDGSWQVRGDCIPGATVTVFNQTLGLGAVYEDLKGTGHYAVVITANQCDTVTIQEEAANEVSEVTYFQVETYAGGMPTSNVCP